MQPRRACGPCALPLTVEASATGLAAHRACHSAAYLYCTVLCRVLAGEGARWEALRAARPTRAQGDPACVVPGGGCAWGPEHPQAPWAACRRRALLRVCGTASRFRAARGGACKRPSSPRGLMRTYNAAEPRQPSGISWPCARRAVAACPGYHKRGTAAARVSHRYMGWARMWDSRYNTLSWL